MTEGLYDSIIITEQTEGITADHLKKTSWAGIQRPNHKLQTISENPKDRLEFKAKCRDEPQSLMDWSSVKHDGGSVMV